MSTLHKKVEALHRRTGFHGDGYNLGYNHAISDALKLLALHEPAPREIPVDLRCALKSLADLLGSARSDVDRMRLDQCRVLIQTALQMSESEQTARPIVGETRKPDAWFREWLDGAGEWIVMSPTLDQPIRYPNNPGDARFRYTPMFRAAPQESAPPPAEPREDKGEVVGHWLRDGSYHFGPAPASPAPGEGDTARIVEGLRARIGERSEAEDCAEHPAFDMCDACGEDWPNHATDCIGELCRAAAGRLESLAATVEAQAARIAELEAAVRVAEGQLRQHHEWHLQPGLKLLFDEDCGAPEPFTLSNAAEYADSSMCESTEDVLRTLARLDSRRPSCSPPTPEDTAVPRDEGGTE